jgi:hypothetical protein
MTYFSNSSSFGDFINIILEDSKYRETNIFADYEMQDLRFSRR